MIAYTREARQHVADLMRHYETLGRGEVVGNLLAALAAAERRIADDPDAGIAAPRPYPSLIARGHRWLKSGRYWIAYRPSNPPTIFGVFFEAADIPNRG